MTPVTNDELIKIIKLAEEHEAYLVSGDVVRDILNKDYKKLMPMLGFYAGFTAGLISGKLFQEKIVAESKTGESKTTANGITTQKTIESMGLIELIKRKFLKNNF